MSSANPMTGMTSGIASMGEAIHASKNQIRARTRRGIERSRARSRTSRKMSGINRAVSPARSPLGRASTRATTSSSHTTTSARTNPIRYFMVSTTDSRPSRSPCVPFSGHLHNLCANHLRNRCGEGGHRVGTFRTRRRSSRDSSACGASSKSGMFVLRRCSADGRRAPHWPTRNRVGGATVSMARPSVRWTLDPLRAVGSMLSDMRGRAFGRHVWATSGRAHIEVRGMHRPDAKQLMHAVERALRAVDGVHWAEVNAILGHVVVAFDEGNVGLDDLVSLVEDVEEAHQVYQHDARLEQWEHPADPDRLLW